ncbi:SusC/RagA family TonB-linked outer membrane protein [Marinilongibacter aquaticus]|uniref:SusC/RagA family TonB-linked outer membrane protein n=1 Tax=Marinilongibacter aquaticus TaxID=2975157 RepID=UPI0021BDCD10|nr:SusC/RagA family TonB-linked outer membrane protein [Marinilongibacter aquaticus]UBM60189.1 SusC/RagA family TonB-linked outer membrane protein [Marinilongibacter aquaticus]
MKKQLLKHVLFFLLAACGATFAQKPVTGKVIDSSGEALIGVSVVVQGTTLGTTTDGSGAYKINVSPNQSLTFSYIGYKSQTVKVGNQSIIDVEMTQDDQMMNEVVVTALGISKSERTLGYATSTIKADEIQKTASPTLLGNLYGKAPGVTIQTTPGGATSGTSVNIRGFSSITGSTQPLIVLNGVPIRNEDFSNTSYWSDQRIRGNGLNDINPADIESITVLKGASAAALYGSQAVNGVLLITTKSGKNTQGLGVDFTASYTNDRIAYLPRYQNVRGPGYPIALNDAGQDENGFITTAQGNRGLINTNVNFGPKFDGQPVQAWTGEVIPYVSSNGSYADLFQNANSSNASIAITKGGDFGNFRLGFTRQDNQMISVGSKNEKNIFSFVGTINVGKHSHTDVSVNYVNQYTKNRPFKVDRMINNFTGMMDRFEHASWYFDRAITSAGYKYVTGTNQSLTPDENISGNGFKNDIMDFVYNVVSRDYREHSNRVMASVAHTIDFTDYLSLKGRISTDFTSEKNEDKRMTERPLAFGTPTGLFRMENNTLNLAYGDVFLTFNKKVMPDLNLLVMAGYTARQFNNVYSSIGTSGGLSTENLFDLAASVNQVSASGTRQRFVNDAYVGTVEANYKDFLNVQATFRRDRTSTMAPGHNAFNYPSVNAALVLNEAFNMPKAFSFSKLRASWGIVGNYPELYRANIAYSQGSLLVQNDGAQSSIYTNTPTGFGNDRIRPERKHAMEFGWENKFFNNRIGFDLTYYNAQIRDQILPLSIPASSGARTVLTNIGTLRNQGIELAFNATPIKRRDFQWDLIVNAAKNVNKVEKLANNSTELLHADYDGNAAQLRSVVGRPMGDIYVHPVATDANGSKIVDPNGLYKLDADNWIVAGNAMPKLTGGVINNLSYKNFSLGMTMNFRLGGAIMPTGIAWMTSRGLTEESLNYMDAEHGGLSYYLNEDGKGVQTSAASGPNGETVYHDGMLLEGVTTDGEPNTNVISQAVYYNNVYNWGGPQYSSSRYELYVKNNTYAKLRELTLGYSIPSSIAKKLGARNLNVSVFGRNLFFFYRNIKDIDPEQTVAGSKWTQNVNNAGNNPSFRSYGVMLRASF